MGAKERILMTPSIGRIVHYYPTASDNPEDFRNNKLGKPIAAVIVKVHSDECVNLRLITDSESLPWKTSVCFDEALSEMSWSWLPRV